MDWKIISDNWGVVAMAPIPFLAAIASGIFVGWIVVQLIYNTRLAHQQDVINNLRAVALAVLTPRVDPGPGRRWGGRIGGNPQNRPATAVRDGGRKNLSVGLRDVWVL